MVLQYFKNQAIGTILYRSQYFNAHDTERMMPTVPAV